MLSREGINQIVESEESTKEKHMLMKKNLISRKIKKIECLSQSTFTLAETSIKANKLHESEVLKTANNSAFESSRDVHFGAPVAHSTPFVKAEDGKKGKLFGSSVTFIKPQPTLGQSLPRPNLSTFRESSKESTNNSKNNEMRNIDVGILGTKVKDQEQDIKRESNSGSLTTYSTNTNVKSILVENKGDCQKILQNQKPNPLTVHKQETKALFITQKDEKIDSKELISKPLFQNNDLPNSALQLTVSSNLNTSTVQTDEKAKISFGTNKPIPSKSCFSRLSSTTISSVTSSETATITSVSNASLALQQPVPTKAEIKATVSFKFSDSPKPSDIPNIQSATIPSSTEETKDFGLQKPSNLISTMADNITSMKN